MEPQRMSQPDTGMWGTPPPPIGSPPPVTPPSQVPAVPTEAPPVAARVAAAPQDVPVKKCPDCAELVKAEAAVCRFCGFQFAAPAGPSAPTSQPVVATVYPPEPVTPQTAPAGSPYPPQTFGAPGPGAVAASNAGLFAALVLLGALLGLIGQFLPPWGHGSYKLFDGDNLLANAGIGLEFLTAGCVIAAAAIWYWQSVTHRRTSAVLMVVLAGQYLVLLLGWVFYLLGEHGTPGSGTYLGLVGGLIMLGGGLLALKESMAR